AAASGGTLERTSPCAWSSSMPLGSPFLSLEISPPKGLGVLRSMPATLSAAELTTAPWPSARPRMTGLLGETLSRSWRGGKTRRVPEGLDPAAAHNPLTRLGRRCMLLHLCQQIVQALCAFQVERQLALAHSEKVIMRVSEARDDGCAFQVEDVGFRANVGLHVGV